MSEFEISPLRRLRDKFGTHTSHGTAPRISASEGNSPNNGRISFDSEHSVHVPRGGRHGMLSIHICRRLTLTPCITALGRRQRTGSDPPQFPPSSLRSLAHATDGDTSPSYRHQDGFGSRSPSKSHSRATSPFRFIQTLSAGLHNWHHRPEPEEPFVPINPFKSKLSFSFPIPWFRTESTKTEPDIELAEASVSTNSNSTGGAGNCEEVLILSSIKDCITHSKIFVLDVLPRLIYLNILLRLPLLYFSRVARIFREAEVSRPDIQRMIEAGQNCAPPPSFDSHLDNHMAHAARQQQQPPPRYGQDQGAPGTGYGRGRGKERAVHPSPSPSAAAGIGIAAHVGVAAATAGQVPLGNAEPPCPLPIMTPTLKRFKDSWEAFIDSLLREWKTLNVVSALLAS